MNRQIFLLYVIALLALAGCTYVGPSNDVGPTPTPRYGTEVPYTILMEGRKVSHIPSYVPYDSGGMGFGVDAVRNELSPSEVRSFDEAVLNANGTQGYVFLRRVVTAEGGAGIRVERFSVYGAGLNLAIGLCDVTGREQVNELHTYYQVIAYDLPEGITVDNAPASDYYPVDCSDPVGHVVWQLPSPLPTPIPITDTLKALAIQRLVESAGVEPEHVMVERAIRIRIPDIGVDAIDFMFHDMSDDEIYQLTVDTLSREITSTRELEQEYLRARAAQCGKLDEILCDAWETIGEDEQMSVGIFVTVPTENGPGAMPTNEEVRDAVGAAVAAFAAIDIQVEGVESLPSVTGLLTKAQIEAASALPETAAIYWLRGVLTAP